MGENEEKQFPPLIEQGKNFAKSAAEVVKTTIKGYPPFAPYEIQKERLKICNECEYLNVELNRCIECGCNINRKIFYSSSKCPKEKWHSWNNQ